MGSGVSLFGGLALVLVLSACSDGGSTPSRTSLPDAAPKADGPADALGESSSGGFAGTGALEGGLQDGSQAGAASDASPDGANSDTGGTSDGDTADADAGSPVSKFCGDRIRDPILEECDDGPGDEVDTCTPDCRARDAFATPPLAAPDAGPLLTVARHLGSGPHVVAAGSAGFAVVFQESDPAPSVWLQAFDQVGHRAGEPVLVSEGRLPTGAANPVVAALPSGVYAVAWTDGTDGTPDVALRSVDAQNRVLGTVMLAHEGRAGAQQDPDLLALGDEIVVAWTDFFAVHVRKLSAGLAPLGAEEPIALGWGLQGSVALAEHAGSWALAWRDNQLGLDSIRVVAGGKSWATKPEFPGPAGDRPALASMSADSLLVLFSVGRVETDGGVAAGTLRAAALESSSPGNVTSSAISDRATGSAATRPRLVRIADRTLLAWQSDGNPGPSRVLLGEMHGSWDGQSDAALNPTLSLPIAPTSGDLSSPGIARSGRDMIVGVWEDASLVPGRTSPDLGYVLRAVP